MIEVNQVYDIGEWNVSTPSESASLTKKNFFLTISDECLINNVEKCNLLQIS